MGTARPAGWIDPRLRQGQGQRRTSQGAIAIGGAMAHGANPLASLGEGGSCKDAFWRWILWRINGQSCREGCGYQIKVSALG